MLHPYPSVTAKLFTFSATKKAVSKFLSCLAEARTASVESRMSTASVTNTMKMKIEVGQASSVNTTVGPGRWSIWNSEQ